MKTNTRLLEYTRKYRKTPKGVLTNMYQHMIKRHVTTFPLSGFQEVYLTNPKFLRIYKEWVKSGYQTQFKPSLDRIDCKQPYTFENTQMLTWAENRYKQTMERRTRKGAVLQLMGNKTIKRFISQRQAVMQTGISQTNMSFVLNGKRETAGGYKFIYENSGISQEGDRKGGI